MLKDPKEAPKSLWKEAKGVSATVAKKKAILKLAEASNTSYEVAREALRIKTNLPTTPGKEGDVDIVEAMAIQAVINAEKPDMTTSTRAWWHEKDVPTLLHDDGVVAAIEVLKGAGIKNPSAKDPTVAAIMQAAHRIHPHKGTTKN